MTVDFFYINLSAIDNNSISNLTLLGQSDSILVTRVQPTNGHG